ncbi:hypothetical protein B0H16DRAFT_1473889 [Mycena metata]|uniref:Uncharacterized protein n=1 Tax=Mycena metata TaxID=1033252 RepID=A0AAD7HJF8_9AGAR|nr:hypothetical protein B0H16DRAFT_1473889 [Mycena metata]
MRQGQFSKEQRLYIESYFDAFTAQLDEGLIGKKLTEWKQKTASEILDAPPLAGLSADIPRREWYTMIVRKFTNYRNQVYLKNRPSAPTPSVIGGPLFRFSSELTGRQLFAKDNSTLINSTAAARITTAGHGSLAAVYQTVLRELWDALPESKQLEWGQRAEEGMGDTDQNQSEFHQKMHLALKDLTQGGQLGDAEMLLFYAFRKPVSGDLDIGTIHAHSVHNRTNFGGTRAELQTNHGDAWAIFADTVIPRPIVSTTSVIPRNSSGIPVFPSVDLNDLTPADTRVLLTEYWMHVWAYSCNPDSEFPQIPWGEIAAKPSVYYDTTKFTLPYALTAPAKLNTVETTVWAEYLVRTSSMFEETPFVFYPKVPVSSSLPVTAQENLLNSGVKTPKDTTALNPNTITASVEKPTPPTQDASAEFGNSGTTGTIIEESLNLEREQSPAPLQPIINQVQVHLGGGGGQKRPRFTAMMSSDDQEDSTAGQGKKRWVKKAKHTENAGNKGGIPSSSDIGRRKSTRVPRKAAAPSTVKKASVKRRTVDEEEEEFATNIA